MPTVFIHSWWKLTTRHESVDPEEEKKREKGERRRRREEEKKRKREKEKKKKKERRRGEKRIEREERIPRLQQPTGCSEEHRCLTIPAKEGVPLVIRLLPCDYSYHAR